MPNKYTRDDFMSFFRDEERLVELSNDDRVEIFRTILIGKSDLTKELLNEILLDYSVSDLKIVDNANISKPTPPPPPPIREIKGL